MISGTVSERRTWYLFHNLVGELGLDAEANAPLLRLGDTIELPLAPNVVLELGDERQDAHHQLAGTVPPSRSVFVSSSHRDNGQKLSFAH